MSSFACVRKITARLHDTINIAVTDKCVKSSNKKINYLNYIWLCQCRYFADK